MTRTFSGFIFEITYNGRDIIQNPLDINLFFWLTRLQQTQSSVMSEKSLIFFFKYSLASIFVFIHRNETVNN